MNCNARIFGWCRFLVLFASFAALAFGGVAVSQTIAGYKVGTITAVKPHKATAKKDSSAKRYEVSVRVEDVTYVVLITPPNGSQVLEYKIGIDYPVRIDGNIMNFSDALGNPMSAPIISRTSNQQKNE